MKCDWHGACAVSSRPDALPPPVRKRHQESKMPEGLLDPRSSKGLRQHRCTQHRHCMQRAGYPMPALGCVWIPEDDAAEGSQTVWEPTTAGMGICECVGAVLPQMRLRGAGSELFEGWFIFKSKTH